MTSEFGKRGGAVDPRVVGHRRAAALCFDVLAGEDPLASAQAAVAGLDRLQAADLTASMAEILRWLVEVSGLDADEVAVRVAESALSCRVPDIGEVGA